MQRVWDMLWDPKSSIFCDTPSAHFDKTPKGYVPRIKLPPPGSPGGGFVGEYDQTQSFTAGETFTVTDSLVIAGITVLPGYYGVPPAFTDSKGRTWAGKVPANPTGNAVPQYPLPTLGAAPNNVFYAQPIIVYCGGY